MIKEPVKRADVPAEDTWDLSLMYKTVEDWEAELVSISKLPAELNSLKEKAVSTSESLLEAIISILQAYRRVEKVFTYAHMLQDQDLSDPLGNEMNQKAISRSGNGILVMEIILMNSILFISLKKCLN